METAQVAGRVHQFVEQHFVRLKPRTVGAVLALPIFGRIENDDIRSLAGTDLARGLAVIVEDRRALGALAPERLRALRHVAAIESIGSSTRIEGSKLTDREVERLLANLEIKKFSTRDEQEVAGYAEVMETIFQAWAEIPITENHIKQLHRDLLRYSDKDERHRGEYKTLRNDVGAFDTDGKMIGVGFETATPFDTPRRMQELVTWLKDARELKRLHPCLLYTSPSPRD